ncbi:MAG: hypothetical protein ABIU20_00665 [Blastocatellia bacterium]
MNTRKNIIVLNDEAHHCYRRKPDSEDEALTGDDRVEAKNRDEEARIWISGIQAVKAKIGVKAIYDFSATPFFLRGSGYPEGTLFPQLLGIAKRWMAECVRLKDNTFPQLLLLIEFAHDAADRIYKAIVASTDGTAALKPILRPYDTLGSTRYVDFDTTRPVFATLADKCHLSHVVADTDSWEQKLAQAMEDMPEVIRYVKNHNLGFTIPYTLNGEEKNYIPDFIACIDDGHGPDDLLNLIVEGSGQQRKDKAAKVATASTLWAPAINNHGGFGRWAFIEIADPWDAQNHIRGFL